MATAEILQTPGTCTPRGSKITRAVDALNRNSTRVFLGITGLYFLITIVQSVIRLMWFDEFITLYIAKLNSFHAIWAALMRGTDPNPPLMHLLVMWSIRLFGENSVAVRLPAILASFLGIACLYFFLQKRIPVIYAVAGTCFFMATAAFDYSYEGRSYALTLGFAMLSLLAWRWAVEGKHRLPSSALLAVALAAGISSNYFAVLAFFPIAAGELVRNIEKRKLEFRVWIALSLGGLPFLLYLPLINHAIATFSPYAWNKPKFDVIPDSYTEMVEVILIPALIIFAAGAWAWVRGRRTGNAILLPDRLPTHEMVAVLVNMLYPFIGYGIAVAHAGMISPRFLIPMCYGFAIATAVLCYRLFGRSRVAGFAVLLLFFSWVLARESYVADSWLEQREAFERVQQHLPDAKTIAVSDSLLVMPLYYYSSPEIASRIVFPIDFKAIREWKHEDSPEQNLWAGRNSVFPVPVIPLQQLDRSTPNYLIVTTPTNWLIWKLAVQGHAPQKLPIWPRAGNIGGFTPLCHGEPLYFDKGDAVSPALFASAPANSRRRGQ